MNNMEKVKKIILSLILILALYIIQILQITVFEKINILGIAPNLFIIYIAFLAKYTNRPISYFIVIFYSLVLKSGYTHVVAIDAIAGIIIIELIIRLNKYFYSTTRIANVILITGITIIFEILKYLIQIVKLGYIVEIGVFSKLTLIEAIFNALILIVIYPAYKGCGNLIDEKINEKNILTRYY